MYLFENSANTMVDAQCLHESCASPLDVSNNSKATVVTTHQANQSQKIYLHKETSFMFDISSVLIQIDQMCRKRN